ncbi:MAG: hypothetical protein ACLFQ7_03890 [Phormidium sp.]
MSVIDSSQTFPTSGIITGTFVDLWDNGDDFILDRNGTQYIVDPEGTDARNFNFSPGETLEVRVDEFDGREIDSNSITRVAATTGTPTTTAATSTLNGFDGDRYLRENPDVAAAGVDPAQHFWDHGALEGRVPDLFDETFYLQSNPDVAAAVAANSVSSGWEHFRYHGALEGRQGSATGSVEFNQAIAAGLGNPAPTPPSNDPLTGSPMVDSDRNVTGTLVGFWDDGDDFLLDVEGTQYIVDPEGTDARNLNLSVGDRLMVRVDEFDGREIDSSSITRLTDGAEPTLDSTPDPLTRDPLTNFSQQTVQGTVVRLTDEDDFLLDTPNGRFEVETFWDERQGVLPVQPGQSLTVVGRFDDELSSLGVPEFEASQVILGDGSRLI